MGILFLIGAIQALFFSLLLIDKKAKKTDEKILLIWLILLGTHLLVLFSLYSGLFNEYYFLTIIHITFPLLHYPLFFLYVKTLIKKTANFHIKYFLLFIPYLILFLLHILFTDHNLVNNYKFLQSTDHPTGLIHLNLIFNLVTGLIYMFLCLVQLKRYDKKIKTQFSNIDIINLKWLAHLIIGFFVVLIIGIICILVTKWFVLKVDYNIDVFIYGSITIFIFFIGFYSLKKTNLYFNKDVDFEFISVTTKSINEEVSIRNKYEIYGLKKDDAVKLKEQLLLYMIEKKPYLDCNLSLTELAESLGIFKHYLTQVLNDQLNLNFYDFINSYRIEEVKNLLVNKKYNHYTLYAIALEAGFNSKSTFNRIFKKYTGLTPSQFKNTF